MKLLLLTDANSVHNHRWVKSLIDYDIELGIFSFYDSTTSFYKDLGISKYWSLGLDSSIRMNNGNNFAKLLYLRGVIRIREIIKEFNPDIFHAHYASSYGLVGALSGFHPFILSIWGADIYNFPYSSPIHNCIIRFNLNSADRILSTSKTMKEQTKKFTSKKIFVTPFGIDVEKYFPNKINRPFAKDDIVIGTIKSLEKIWD